jgi:hypothetical protein
MFLPFIRLNVEQAIELPGKNRINRPANSKLFNKE